MEYGYELEMGKMAEVEKSAFIGAAIKTIGGLGARAIGKAMTASPAIKGVANIGAKAMKIAPAAMATGATLSSGKGIIPTKIAPPSLKMPGLG